MGVHHILTIGISLLTNFCHDREMKRSEAVRKGADLYDYLKKNPRKASAELNSLLLRLEQEGIPLEGIGVTLVYTQTVECRVIASLLAKWLAAQNVKVSEIKAKGIQLPSRNEADLERVAHLARQGLVEMKEKVRKHVASLQKAKPALRIEFNATGGFKTETAVLYGLGRELNVPVYYLHDTYHTVLTLP